nr:putative ABC exporter domain-containing protein [Maliibacterium massiliense]
MRALLYLFGTTLKNSFKQMLKSPAKLIGMLFMVLMVVLMVVAGSAGERPVQELRPSAELYAMVLLLYLCVFVMGIMRGLTSGATFYGMCDVNILFATPIAPRRILFYGLLRQMGTSLLVGFFLIFQYAWLHMTYGLSFGGLMAVLVGYGVVMFSAQLTAMAIYSFSSGNECRQKVIRGVIYAGVVLLAGAILAQVLGKGDMLAAAVTAADALWLKFLPVAGWMQAMVVGILSNEMHLVLLGVALCVSYTAVIVVAMTRARTDFYEDVLQATEVSYSAITAAKEGKMKEAVPTRVKLGKLGINGGFGASAFYHKHKLENRRARVFILDNMSLLYVAMGIVFAFFMRNSHGALWTIFFFTVYLQMFTTAMGRWARELIRPFIYMTPEPAFKKLVMICLENIEKIAVEAVVLYIPVALILQVQPMDVLACIIARIGFGILFMAGNILAERVLGSLSSRGMIMGLYFLILLALMAPGIIAGVLLMMFVPPQFAMLACLGVITLWNIGASALITFLCRNILDYAELNNR